MAIPSSRVLINDLDNKEELYAVLQEELRKGGIKYRKEKSSKASNGEKNKGKRIFKTPLHALELTDVLLANGGLVQIPLFVSNACQFILENVDTEGLFRKAGSTKRQQQMKASLESGIPLGKSHHVIDVANIIKTFFRDLPEALLPSGNVQEALIRCLLGGGHGDKVHKLMMTCLLLPPLTLNTLAYFMQFLHTVSMHAAKNRMTAENLAIILTPSVMPITESVQQRFNSHVKVLQLLIENSQQIGLIPEVILSQLKDDTVSNISMALSNVTDKKKKKRRSGSLTRMFNGFKKMVSAIGSSENLDKTDERCENDPSMVVGTPCLSKSAKKRKVTDGIAFSAKKKKEVTSLLPDNHDLLPCTPLVVKEPKKSRLSLGGSKKPSKVVQRLLPTGSIPSIAEGKPMERRWSVVGAPWGRKKQNRPKVQEMETSTDLDGGTKTEDEFDSDPARKSLLLAGGRMSPVVSLPCLVSAEGLSTMDDKMNCDLMESKEEDETDGDDFLKIRRSEYEAIKKRMSDIESKLSKEFTALVGREDVLLDNVEDKYRQTLEQTEPIEATCATTDQLAKRLSRELKIRQSGEHKVIRSPSARKIGTIRRRSREAVRLSRNQSWHVGNGARDLPATVTSGTVDLSFYPKSGVLKRGRPNTVQSGLKAPDASVTSTCSEPAKSGTEKQTEKSTICLGTSSNGGNYTDEEKEEQWVNAESYFETHNVTDDNASSVMDSTAEFLTPCKVLMEDYFKTPDQSTRRASLRSASRQNAFCTPTPLVTRVDVQGAKTPMLPPVVPPRIKTPARTPKLPPRTPSSATRLANSANLLKTHITPLQEAQSGRASIARIRSQNAGMVMAKAKLFDGLVTNASLDLHTTVGASNRTPISNRRQSAKFRSAFVAMPQTGVTSADGMPRESAVQIRQIQKLRSSSAQHGNRSPRKSTPRKRAFTKSSHGGAINRREKLRQATKGGTASGITVAGGVSSKALLSSPRIVRRLQENVQEHLAVTNVNVVCRSPNVKDTNSGKAIASPRLTTPHIRKQLLRSSPRRILAATPGRDNRMPQGERFQTPLKATPLSRFAISAAPGFENNPERSPHTRAANVR
uniref:Rho-GAP domain-containing protein n=1 Tax=Anopheles culicifacies TaxID=139723 RepID=A0A182LWJ5_9DIPT